MAMYDDHLTDAMAELSVNDDRWKELGLDDQIQSQLIKIENDYESIFSWGIQRLTGVNQNLMLNLVEKVREKQEVITSMEGKDNEFNLNRFYLQLVASYELYNSKSYKESYLEIENVIQFLETCKFDESYEQYTDAYRHIARATNAYIALTLNIDSEKLLKDIKMIFNFNCAEKAAINAVKARVFMEYPPKGNEISLEFASRACNLQSAEPEWILIWLKAKGRVRRYYQPFEMPGNDEMNAANMLCSTKSKSHLLIEAYQIYKEAGFVMKKKNNHNESNKYYKLSSDIAKKSVELAKDDTKQLYFILMRCYDFPNGSSKSIIDNLVTKLSNVKNSCVDQALGLYYLRNKKDYVKAKMHLSRGKAAGQFNTALQLIKVECLLQSVNTFPYVHTLNMMYDNFSSPVRRLVILIHLLMYYNYCEKNPKEMMRYLKLYIDQDIDDNVKKRHLIFARPLFTTDKFFKPNEFLNALSVNIKDLMNYKWSMEEKQMIDYTFDRFNKILKLNSHDDNINDYNKTTIHEKKVFWRKRRVDISENQSNESHKHQSTSKYIINQNKSLEKHNVALDKEPSRIQHNIMDNNLKLPINKSIVSMNSLNNSDGIETNPKKFENKFSSFGNIHVVSLENNSINKPISNSRTRGYSTRGTRARSSNTRVSNTTGGNIPSTNPSGSFTRRSTRGSSTRGRYNRHGSYKPIRQNLQDDSENEEHFSNISDLWD